MLAALIANAHGYAGVAFFHFWRQVYSFAKVEQGA